MWDLATSQKLGPSLQRYGDITPVAFSPDGRTILTGGEKGAWLWEVPAVVHPRHLPLGRTINKTSPNFDRIVAISGDHKTMLTMTSPGESFCVRELTSGKPLGPPLPQKGFILWGGAISPEGKAVLLGCGKEARLWDVASAEPLGPSLPHDDVVTAVAFGPDGKIVVTASGNKAEVWNATTGKLIVPPLLLDCEIWDLAVSPDGRIVVTGSGPRSGGKRGDARLWDLATGQHLGILLPHSEPVIKVAFSPDGKTIMTASGRTAQLWDAVTGRRLVPSFQHKAPILSIAFSPDNRFVLTGSLDKTARLWDAKSGKLLGPALSHDHGIWFVAFIDNATLLTDSLDETAYIWNISAPVQGDVERIVLWTQVTTGCELDAGNVIREFDAHTWNQRRQRLEELGGPPL
jgi:WD40 repeat protein